MRASQSAFAGLPGWHNPWADSVTPDSITQACSGKRSGKVSIACTGRPNELLGVGSGPITQPELATVVIGQPEGFRRTGEIQQEKLRCETQYTSTPADWATRPIRMRHLMWWPPALHIRRVRACAARQRNPLKHEQSIRPAPVRFRSFVGRTSVHPAATKPTTTPTAGTRSGKGATRPAGWRVSNRLYQWLFQAHHAHLYFESRDSH